MSVQMRLSFRALHRAFALLAVSTLSGAVLCAVSGTAVASGGAGISDDDPVADASANVTSTSTALASSELQEITVTSQRRSESAQKVPVEVHSVSGSQLLESNQVSDVNDISALLPNAQSGDDGAGRPRWFVRGLGTNRTDFATVNPVGVYFDDVYIANLYAQEAPLFDLQRVEADIGPQGTLWGKNANAGAINFISNKPSFSPDGYLNVGYGSFQHSREEGAYGNAINDKLAFRAAFYNDYTQSWQDLYSTGKPVGNTSTVAGRVQLDYVPSEELDVLLNVHAYRRDGPYTGWNYFPDPNLPVSSKIYKNFYPGGYPITPIGVINYIQNSPYSIEATGGSAKITAQLGRLTLTSITGGESLELTQGSGVQMPYPANSPVVGQLSTTASTDSGEQEFSEELRLATPGTDRWTWQSGLFGYYESVDQNALSYTPANQLNPSGNQALGTTTANTYAEWSLATPRQDRWSFAAFGSSTYNFTDSLKVQAGVRWTDEQVSYRTAYYALGNTAANNLRILGSANVLNDPGAPLLYSGSAEHAFPAWIYDFKPQYTITQNILAYLSFAHAVEAGGFSTATDTGLAPASYGQAGAAFSYAAPSLLLPEKLQAYEAGLKSQWFDNRVIFNIAVFDYQISDAVTNVTTQVVNLAVPSGIANGVVFRNAGQAYSRGGEVELDAIPLENWRLSITAGYDRTEYTSQDSPTYNLLGTQIPRAPEKNLQATSSYDQTLPFGWGSLRWAADVNWRSGFWLYPNTCYQLGTGCAAGNSGPDYSFYEKGYAVANAHVTWHPRADKKLSFEIEVLNATDTRYYTHITAGSTTGTTQRLYAPPVSTFGSVNYRF
jgi:iron complex outermembrane receptor protein